MGGRIKRLLVPPMRGAPNRELRLLAARASGPGIRRIAILHGHYDHGSLISELAAKASKEKKRGRHQAKPRSE